jgi:Fe-S cluster biogenesis protein NfuA
MVPLHPQRCPDEPDRLRWITPAGVLPFTGPVAAAPPPIDILLRDGTLADVALEPTAVVTRLGAGRSWQADGPRVRTALHAALADPGGWSGTARSDDAALLAAARRLLDGQVGDFARSHGGRIELLGVQDGVVTVRLCGACHGCPAARFTLHQRLEAQLRRCVPGLRAVAEAPTR